MSSPWGKETQYFINLTPDRILNAVESAGYRCTGRCATLYSMENRVYSVEIEADESVDRWANYRIVKFYRPGRWGKDQLLEEHRFMQDLKENEVPVVPALPLRDGSTLGIEPESGLYFAIYHRIGGRLPDEISDEDLPIVARLMARLHNVGRATKAQHRLKLTPEIYGLANLEYLLSSKAIPQNLEKEYAEVVESIVKASGPWFAATDYQRIHGDCHRGNLLWGQDGPFWIDFDDMLVGPPVQDMWLLIQGIEEPGATREIFLESYEDFADFDRSSLRLIEPLRALRYVHFAAWIAKRWQDPTFPNAFPNFGNQHYWQEQINDLREQKEKILALP